MSGGVLGFVLGPLSPQSPTGLLCVLRVPRPPSPTHPTSLVLGTPPPLPGWLRRRRLQPRSVLCSQAPSCTQPASLSVTPPPPDSDPSSAGRPILALLPPGQPLWAQAAPLLGRQRAQPPWAGAAGWEPSWEPGPLLLCSVPFHGHVPPAISENEDGEGRGLAPWEGIRG